VNVAYLILKAATNLYGKSPAVLAPEELERARHVAVRQSELEGRVLASVEARDAMVPESTLRDALAEIRGRYASADDYAADLAGNGLTPDEFASALARELRVEAILEKVGSRAVAVTDIDVELYFHYHPDQFRRQETRLARHILVTINEDIADNRREAARERIEAVAARLARDLTRFEEQAMKHSECPTALQGGVLGEVRRGQLYPELDTVLFDLPVGAISPVVESPLGLHLLRCDAIAPAGPLTLAEARKPIRMLLESRRKRICQQAWLKSLAQSQA